MRITENRARYRYDGKCPFCLSTFKFNPRDLKNRKGRVPERDGHYYRYYMVLRCPCCHMWIQKNNQGQFSFVNELN